MHYTNAVKRQTFEVQNHGNSFGMINLGKKVTFISDFPHSQALCHSHCPGLLCCLTDVQPVALPLPFPSVAVLSSELPSAVPPLAMRWGEVRPLPPSLPGNHKAWPAGVLSLVIIWLCVKVKKLYWLGCIILFFQVAFIRLVSAHASAGYQQQKRYAWGGSPLCLRGCGPNRLILAPLSLVWGGFCLPTSCHRVCFSFSFHELFGCVKEGRWAPACSSADGVQNSPILMR